MDGSMVMPVVEGRTGDQLAEHLIIQAEQLRLTHVDGLAELPAEGLHLVLQRAHEILAVDVFVAHLRHVLACKACHSPPQAQTGQADHQQPKQQPYDQIGAFAATR